MSATRADGTYRPGRIARGGTRVIAVCLAIGMALGLMVASTSPAAASNPGFSLDSPVAGDSLPAGQVHTVRWSGGDPAENVNL